MKLARPYIPLNVRLQVIARQLQENGQLHDVLRESLLHGTKDRLDFMLECRFGDVKVHLDHDPPLCLREIIDVDKGLYEPDANDPRFLVYRTQEDHRIKTFVRGDGAQLSDAAKRRRKIKAERKESPHPTRWPPKGSRPVQWWRPR
jgi:hypothetical protein